MKQSTKHVFLASALLIASVGSAFAFSKEDHKKEAINAVNQAKISLSQAISAAEQKASGKALRAGMGPSKEGGWVYHVGVVNGSNKVMHVSIDPATGNVLSSEEASMGEHMKGKHRMMGEHHDKK
jgi:uncharacterized membrane protein YkoI